MSKYVLVECISQHRMRYMIEVPDDHNEREFPCSAKQWAEDTVTAEECTEFSQEFLGETIVSSREVAKEDIIRLINEDNPYCSTWTDEKKFDTFVTKHKE